VNRIVWLGHSTVLMDLDGVHLLTDPLLRMNVSLLRRTAPIDASALDGIDAVLISHVHQDHLDLSSLRRIGTGTPVVVPRGAGRLLSRLGFTSVTEVVAGEGHRFGDVRVKATPAVHDAHRRWRGVRAPCLGYVVEGSARLYFAGDTDVFPEMADIRGDLDLDVALLPIAGWGPSLGPGHLDPRGAAEALTLLRPRTAVPIHWGTLRPLHVRRTARYLHDPPVDFARYAAEAAPDTRVVVIPPGGTLNLDMP